MTGLINLIAQYSSKLNILPVVVVMNIIITILIHFLAKRKIVKFFPSIALGIGAILLLIYSLNIFTTPRGLDLTWISVFLGTSALVGLFTCFIIDLVKSIKDTDLAIAANEGHPVAQKTRIDVKRKSKKSSDNIRVAKKPSKKRNKKETSSKYYTKKIKANSNGEIKANKKTKTEDVIVFESED